MAGEAGPRVTVDALVADGEGQAREPEGIDEVPRIGEETAESLTAGDLFDPAATARVVVLWVLTPTVAAVASSLVFRLVPRL